MKYAHGVLHSVKFSVVSCFMDVQARQSIAETLARKHNIDIDIEIDEEEIKGPTLQTYNIASLLNDDIENKANLEVPNAQDSKIQIDVALTLEEIEIQKNKIYKIFANDDDCEKSTTIDDSDSHYTKDIKKRNNVEMQCNPCGTLFSDEHSFKRHKRTKHRKTKDDVLVDILKEESELLLQEDVFENTKNICPKEMSNSNKISPSKSSGKRSIEKTSSKENRWMSQEEVVELQNFVSLALTFKILKPIDSKLECQICKQSFARSYHLRRHIRNKHVEYILPEIETPKQAKLRVNGKFKCQRCDVDFSNNYCLRKHTKRKHSVANELRTSKQAKLRVKGKFICQKCDVNFSDNYSLRRHTKRKHSLTDALETPKNVPIKDATVENSSLRGITADESLSLLLPSALDIAMDELLMEEYV